MATKSYKSKLILFFCLIFTFLAFKNAHGANLYLESDDHSYVVGSVFTIDVKLNTQGDAVNMVESELLFPADRLQLVSYSVGKSAANLWPVLPSSSDGEGRVYFVGGVPTPGIKSDGALLISLIFKPLKSGSVTVSFGEKTSILANDGQGTNILKGTSPLGLSFTYAPSNGPIVSSITHMDQQAWYSNTNPIVFWPKTSLSEAFSYSVDQRKNSDLDSVSEGLNPTFNVRDLKDGKWFFHIKEKIRGVWSQTSDFALQIDSTPPEEFSFSIYPSPKTMKRDIVLRFEAEDSLSGLDHYEVKTVALSKMDDQSMFEQAFSPYQVNNLLPGRYNVVVRAYDKAGNFRERTQTITILSQMSQLTSLEGINLQFVMIPWSWVVVLFGVLLIYVWIKILFIWKRHRVHLKSEFANDMFRLKNIFKDEDENK